MYVKAKKSLGQHFLKDQKIAERIVESLDLNLSADVLEIGPGTGVLTQHLVNLGNITFLTIYLHRFSLNCLITGSRSLKLYACFRKRLQRG